MDEETEQQAKPAAGKNVSLLSLTAIALSVAALLVSVFEVSAIRDEQRIQVWPFVQLSQGYNSEGFELRASNKGIGPARIRGVTMRLDGEVVDELDDLIVRAVGEENAFSYEMYRTSDINRSVMSADEQVTLFATPWEPRSRLLVQELQQRFELEVCYCSVYDECWTASLDDVEPATVARCD